MPRSNSSLVRAEPETVLAQEQLFWTSYVAGDTKTLDTVLAPDFTSPEQ